MSPHSNDETQLNTDETRMAPTAATTVASSTTQSGWLSSTGSVDHGRFAPGTMLDNRYRVLGLLGRGGMGEVYRADDLRLGQQVALKFLPETLATDARRLAQFHNEVRTARQVSHPNVCRVYDIGELNGQMFLTMEYVDGEDLSILLRRIGRLPEERAIEIARQICAGLAAAHERGILHRDLKPANIMLDGAGKVRIMDFSLAAIGKVEDIRAGTPAYMAPEQLSGLEVTTRSDVYALGLVLYEVFTGRRAFEAKTIADLVAQHQSGSITSPMLLVASLDQAVDRAIMRCLESDPLRRPASALAVAASLPGGDPLAAALAAGETPSPEMVAAAGGQGATLTFAAGASWFAVLLVMIWAGMAVADRTSLIAKVPLTKSGEVLADRADELRQSLGYSDRVVDRASGFTHDAAYLEWVKQHSTGRDRWDALASGRPASMLFWHRTSPIPLVPKNPLAAVSPADPPSNINGMTLAVLDTQARLIRFEAAPPQQETAAPAVPVSVDWSRLFTAAAIDMSTFRDIAPSRTPPVFADERRAWEGTLTGSTVPVRIEAASYRGRSIMFEVVAPWTTTPRDARDVAPPNNNNPFFIALLLIGAVVAARANLKSGRADRRGAFRIAAVMVAVILSIWLLEPHVIQGASEQQRFFANAGIALFLGGAMYLIYLGLEPFVRRSSPTILIGWSRVIAGRLRDPLIGRDLLIGAACGAALAVVTLMRFALPAWVGFDPPAPYITNASILESVRSFIADLIATSLNSGLQSALITVFEWVTFRVIVEWLWTKTVRRLWPSATAAPPEMAIAVFGAVLVGLVAWASGPSGHPGVNAVVEFVGILIPLVVILRVGLLASVVMFMVAQTFDNMSMTLDSSRLYASGSWVVVSLVLGLAALGFWMARSGDVGHARVERNR